jgi:hypothetical protein
MIRAIVLWMMMPCACGGRIHDDSDASTDSDGGNDATTTNDTAGTTSTSSDGGVITCGPNTCHAGEICCNAKCGVCTFPDECVVHDCGGP